MSRASGNDQFVDALTAVETANLVLRPVESADLAQLVELRSDPRVARYLPNAHPPAADDVARALEAELELVSSGADAVLWAVQLKGRRRLIGHVAIWPRGEGSTRGELIVSVMPRHWGRGVATEACTGAIERWLGLHPGSIVYGAVHPDNTACHTLMRKIGLDREAAGADFPGIHEPTERVFYSSTKQITGLPG